MLYRSIEKRAKMFNKIIILSYNLQISAKLSLTYTILYLVHVRGK